METKHTKTRDLTKLSGELKQMVLAKLEQSEKHVRSLVNIVADASCQKMDTNEFRTELKRLFSCIGVYICLVYPKSYSELLSELFSLAKDAIVGIDRQAMEIACCSHCAHQDELEDSSDTSSLNLEDTPIPRHTLTLTPIKSDKDFFDFSKNEKLCIERILRSCYLNQDRMKFPGKVSSCVICLEHDQPDHYLQRINKELSALQKKFNNTQIRLHNTSKFSKKSESGDDVDPKAYIEQITACRWYGPYVKGEARNLFFFSYNNNGSNEYVVRLQISFSRKNIAFSYMKNSFNIAPSVCYCLKR